MNNYAEVQKIENNRTSEANKDISRRDFIKLATAAAGAFVWMTIEGKIISAARKLPGSESITPVAKRNMQVDLIYGAHSREHKLPDSYRIPPNIVIEGLEVSGVGASLKLYNYTGEGSPAWRDGNSIDLLSKIRKAKDTVVWGLEPRGQYSLALKKDLAYVESSVPVSLVERFIGLTALIGTFMDKKSQGDSIAGQVKSALKSLTILYLTAPKAIEDFLDATKNRAVFTELQKATQSIHPEIGVTYIRMREILFALKLSHLEKNGLLQKDVSGNQRVAMTLGEHHVFEKTLVKSDETLLQEAALLMPLMLELYDPQSIYSISKSKLDTGVPPYLATEESIVVPELKALVDSMISS